jgi:hypothetical protein
VYSGTISSTKVSVTDETSALTDPCDGLEFNKSLCAHEGIEADRTVTSTVVISNEADRTRRNMVELQNLTGTLNAIGSDCFRQNT